MSSDVYRIWEDSRSETNLVITRNSNPQYAYVANYPWIFFVDDKKLHILAYFFEEPNVECHVKVKIWYPNREFQRFERQEHFPFGAEEGDTYELEEGNWENIEIFFRVDKLDGAPYEGAGEPEQLGLEVAIGGKNVYLDVELLEKESDVLKDLKTHCEHSTSPSQISIHDVDSDAFLEMLRVIHPPHKRISKYNFFDVLHMALRFEMCPLLDKLESFAKSDECDKRLLSKWNLSRIERLLPESHQNIRMLDEFRVKKRLEKPLKSVRFREPEVEAVHENVDRRNRSWLGHVANWCSVHKTRLLFVLLFLLFVENVLLLLWFLCIHRGHC